MVPSRRSHHAASPTFAPSRLTFALVAFLLVSSSFLVILPPSGAAAGAITPTLATNPAGQTQAGKVATYEFTFTPQTTWPASGRVQVQFPTGFDLQQVRTAAVTATPAGCSTASKAVTVTSNIVTLVREATDLPCLNAASVTLSIPLVKNPLASGAYGPFVVRTFDPSGVLLDEGSIATFSIIPNVFTSLITAPLDPTPGALTTLRIAFATTNPWPGDGRLFASLPAGFAFSPASVTAHGCTSGTFSAILQAGILVQRADGETCGPGSYIMDVAGIQLPATATTATFTVTTQNGLGAAIDQGTSSVFVASALSATTAIPTSPVAGAATTYSFGFTIAQSWLSTGTLSIYLPTGYQLGTGTATLSGSCPSPGNLARSATTNPLVLTRSAGSNCNPGSITVTVPGITSPPLAGDHALLMKIENTAGTPLAVAPALVQLSPAAMQSPSVSPVSSNAGATPSRTFSFVQKNPLPSDGRFVATFPDGFDVTNAGTTVTSTCSGTFTVAKDIPTRQVTVTRNGDGTACPAGSQSFSGLTGIKNPGIPGNPEIGLLTLTNSGVPIDTGTVPITLTTGALAAVSPHPFVATSSSLTGTTATYTFRFRPENDWPADGRFVARFPTSFKVANAAAGTLTNCVGPFEAVGSEATKEITVTRLVGSSVCPSGTDLTLTVSGIEQPSASGAYDFPLQAFRTQSADGIDIDIDPGPRWIAVDANTLTDLQAVPADPMIGKTTTYKVSFRTTNPLPFDGSIDIVTFGAFGLGAVSPGTGVVPNNCTSGQFLLTKTTSQMTLTRSGGQDCPGGITVDFEIPGIKNPGSEGPYPLSIVSRTASGAVIEDGALTINVGAKSMTNPSVTPTSTAAGASTTYTFRWTLGAIWPANGKLVATFPADIPITSITAGSLTGCTGTFGVQKSGLELTAVRNNDGADCGNAPVEVALTVLSVLNPSTAGARTISLATTTSSNQRIEMGTVIVTINPGVMTLVSAVPAVADAGADTTYAFTFKPANPWSNTGRLIITVPDNQILSNVELASITPSCNTGTFLLTVPAPSRIEIARSGGASCSGSSITVSIKGIQNPPNAGTTGPFLLRTQTASRIDVDGASVSAFITPAPMTSPLLALTDNRAGEQTSYAFSFTPKNPWPGNGKFVASFPSGVDLSTLTGVTTTGCTSGTFTAVRDVADIIVTRTNGQECGTAAPITLTFTGIRNPSTARDITVTAKTRTSSGADIDTATVLATIAPGQFSTFLVTPGSTVLGADNVYTFDIVPRNPWPAGGQLVVALPNGFAFGDSAIATASGCTTTWGTPTKSTNPPTFTVTRTGTGTCASALRFTISHVLNPSTAGTFPDLTVTTKTSTGEPIDRATATITIQAASLGLTVTPGNLAAGATTTYTFVFTNSDAAPWPRDGRLRIEFPAGFDLSQATGAATNGCTSGAFNLQRQGVVLLVDRSGTTSDCTVSATYVVSNVKNPLEAGPAASALVVKTQTQNGAADIGQGTANLVIQAGALGSTLLTPATAPVGTLNDLVFRFRLERPWDANAKFAANLPLGFAVADLDPSVTPTGCTTGTFTASSFTRTDNGYDLIVSRAGGQACDPETLVTLTVQGIRAPTTAAAHTIPIRTRSLQGADIDVGSVTLTTTPGNVSPATSTLAADPATLPADGTSTADLILLLRDAFGNRILQNRGAAHATPNVGTVSPAPLTYDGEGRYTGTYTAPTTLGTALITVQVGSIQLDAPATIQLFAGDVSATTSLVSVSSHTLTADGTSQALVTVRLRDAHGNFLATTGGTLTLSTDLGTTALPIDHEDGTYTSIYTADTQAGTATISAQLTKPNGAVLLLAQTGTIQLRAGPAGFMTPAVPLSMDNVVAGTTQTLQVRVTDDYDNAVAGVTVTWTRLGTNGAVSPASSLTNAEGIASTVLTTAGTVGENQVSADGGNLVGGTRIFVVNTIPGPAAAIMPLSPLTQTGHVVQTSTHLSVRVLDAHENAVAGVTVAWTVLSGGGIVSAPAISTDPTGVSLVSVTTGTIQGLNTFKASVASIPAQAKQFDITTVAAAADPTRTTFTANPTQIVANGQATSTVTVRLKDVHGNTARSTATPSAQASRGEVTSITTNPDGTYTVILKAGTVAGPSNVVFSLDGSPHPPSGTVTFVGGAPVSMRNESALTVNGIPAGTVRELEVKVRDANGNGVPNVRIAWAPSAGASVSAATSQTDVSGIARTTLTTADRAGANTVRATNQTLTGSPVQFTVNTVVGDPVKIATVGATMNNVTAGSSPSLSAKVMDAHGNGIKDSNVTWTITSGPGTLTKGWSLTDATGVATTTLKTTNTPATVKVAAINTSLQGSPAEVTFITKPSYTITQNGTSPVGIGVGNDTLLKVRIKDQSDAAVVGARLVWSVAAGGGSVSPTSSVTDADGIASTTLTTGLVPGDNKIVATHTTIVGSPLTLTVRTVPGPAQGLRLTGIPATVATDSPFHVTVEVIDEYGNVAPKTGTVTLAIASGTTGQLKGTPTASLSNGAATVRDLRLAQAGSYRLLATVGSFQETSSLIVAYTPPPANNPNTSGAEVGSVATNAKPFFVPTVAAMRRTDGSVEVTWTKPTQQNIAGYLVWRASSPFALVAEIGMDNDSFIDHDAGRDQDHRYAVTFFLTSGAGYVEVKGAMLGLAKEATMPSSALVDSESKAKAFLGSTATKWAYLGGIALVLIAGSLVGAALIVRRRNAPQNQFIVIPTRAAPKQATPSEPAPEQPSVQPPPNGTTRNNGQGSHPPAQRIRVPRVESPAPQWRSMARTGPPRRPS